MRTFLATAFLAFVLALPANAGPQYVDRTGYAVSGYDVVAYQSLSQSPAGQRQPSAVPGKTSITADFNGAKWAFSSEENKTRFLADPEKYIPAFDGHCAYGIAQRSKVPGNPNLWRIRDGQLYLNFNRGIDRTWHRSMSRFIKKGNRNWRRLQKRRASRDAVPAHKSSLAPEKL